MTHRAVRLIVLLAAVAAVIAGGYLYSSLEHRIASLRTGAARFDAGSRDARLLLEMLRTAQQSYVAQGQGPDFWMTKATAHIEALHRALASLDAQATGEGPREALTMAQEALAAFEKIDRRARSYVQGGQELMASDLIFTESLNATSTMATQLDTAHADEQARAEAAIARLIDQRTYVLGGTAAICLLAALLLLSRVQVARPPDTREALRALINDRRPASNVQVRPEPATRIVATPAPAPPPPAPEPTIVESVPLPPAPAVEPPASVPRIDLAATAHICSDLARVLDPADLQALLDRAAHLLDAKGLIVWVADRAGAALFPTLATGYAPAVLARMGTIGRDDDNAAADAFREADARVVDASASAPAALVTPINTAEGCVGVLAAEMQPGASITADTTAVARIIAAQLATFVTTLPAGEKTEA